MKIKEVTIRGIHKVEEKTYSFNNFTYLYGENGAGKTTVLQAIQWCLLGHIPNTKKTNTAIFEHCNNGKKMEAEVVLENGDEEITIYRRLKKEGSKLVEESNLDEYKEKGLDLFNKLELPLNDFNSFIGMTANQLKDWFLSVIACSSDFNLSEALLKDIDTGDKEEVKEWYEGFVDEACDGEYENVIDKIKGANSYTKETLSVVKAEYNEKNGALRALTDVEDDTTDIVMSIDEIDEKINELTKTKSKLELYIKNKEQYEEKRQELAELDEDFIPETELAWLETKLSDEKSIEDYKKTLADEIDKYQEKADEADKKVTETERLINRLADTQEDLKSKLEAGDGVCPFTQMPCKDMTEVKEGWEKQYNENAARYTELNEEYKKIADECTQLKEELKELADEKQRVEEKATQYAMVKNAVEVLKETMPVGVENANEEEINAELEKLQKMRDRLVASKDNEGKVQQLIEGREVLEQEIEILKEVEKKTGANGYLNDLTVTPFASLANNITAILAPLWTNPNIKADFNLEAKANTFSFGIYDFMRQEYIRYDLLSSGEKCVYILAMLIALVLAYGCTLPLLMIDDIFDHLDEEKSRNLFDKLFEICNNNNMQIILAGVQTCKSLYKTEFMQVIE